MIDVCNLNYIMIDFESIFGLFCVHVAPSNLWIAGSAENFSDHIVSTNEVLMDLLTFKDIYTIRLLWRITYTLATK